jgi:hypothetical protein
MEQEYKNFQITDAEWDKFVETSELLTVDTYNKLNTFYANKKKQCGCIKTDVKTIYEYFKSSV